MAGSVTSFTGKFDPETRDLSGFSRKVSLACFGAGTSAQRQTARTEIFCAPDFIVNARTDSAETLAVAELIAKGVTFPAASMRVLEIEAYVAGNAADETGWLRHTALVSGGTTPIVRVVTVPASTPVQVGGNTLTGVAGAGFAATPAVTVVAGASTLTVNVVSAEAEILNWRVTIKVGKLQPMLLGI
jgi:hypothetical protein